MTKRVCIWMLFINKNRKKEIKCSFIILIIQARKYIWNLFKQKFYSISFNTKHCRNKYKEVYRFI